MDKAISSDLIRGHIDTIILHSLLDGDKFAQQISDAIEKKSNGEYVINQATLYSSLKRLENLKYVSAYWNDGANGRRRFFRLSELGKSVVDKNLDNWSYSRAIIDKLMDLQPEPIYKTQFVDRIVEKPVYLTAPTQEQVSPVACADSVKTVDSAEIKPVDSVPNPASSEKSVTTGETVVSEQEINFRNILNGLIKEKKVSKESQENADNPVTSRESSQEITDGRKLDVESEKSDEKLKLSETITNSNYNTLKQSNGNGNIDYGEMVSQAEKEGYKLMFSTKESKKTKGTVYLNKVDLFASLITFIVVMLEYLLIMTFCKNVLNPSLLAVVLSIVALAIFPVVMTVIYCVKPSFSAKKVKKDSLLTALIVIFNLILITLAVNLIVGVDFGSKFYLIVAVIVPIVLFADIMVYYLSRYLLSKHRGFGLEN